MTKVQKLAIRLSEIRSKLNELSGVDELTDEQRGELDSLTAEYQQKEAQHRAALTVEADEQRAAEGAFGNGDGEPAEVRALLDRVTIADYLNPAAAGIGLAGAAVELAGALKVPVVGEKGGIALPWRVLAGDVPEARQAPESRAFTTTSQNDGPTGQRPILQRLFGPGIMDTLGVRMDSVPVGMSEWPLVATGVSPAQAKEGDAAAAAVAMTFNFATLKPKRLTGRYEYTHEAAASVSDLEQAIRRDLADAVKSSMSSQIITSEAPTNQNPHRILGGGFLTKIAAPADAAATATYADYAGSHASGCRRHPRRERARGIERRRRGRVQARRDRLSGGLRRVRLRGADAPLDGVSSVELHHSRDERGTGEEQHLSPVRVERRRCHARRLHRGNVADSGGHSRHLLAGFPRCRAHVGDAVGCVRGVPLGGLLASGVQDHVMDWWTPPRSRSGRRRRTSARP